MRAVGEQLQQQGIQLTRGLGAGPAKLVAAISKRAEYDQQRSSPMSSPATPANPHLSALPASLSTPVEAPATHRPSSGATLTDTLEQMPPADGGLDMHIDQVIQPSRRRLLPEVGARLTVTQRPVTRGRPVQPSPGDPDLIERNKPMVFPEPFSPAPDWWRSRSARRRPPT